MINYGHGTVGYVLTFISLIHASFASVISLMVIVIIIYHQYNNRLKRDEKITLLLSANIYSIIFIYVIILISFNIQTLLGDVYEIHFNSSWCIFRGYFIDVIFLAFYHSFVIQAFFRLCRIVYSNCRRFQLFGFYVVILPIQVVVAGVLACPVLVWHGVIYLPLESSCYSLCTDIRSMLWMMFISYVLPLSYLMLIYIRITLFIRQQSNNLAVAIKRRQQRDLVAIQKIFINVGLLVVLGVPAAVLIIMALITGIAHPLIYRILLAGYEISTAVLSVEMVFMTPQLKHIVLRRWQQNRLAIIEVPIQMRPITAAE